MALVGEKRKCLNTFLPEPLEGLNFPEAVIKVGLSLNKSLEEQWRNQTLPS